jgi:DNA-binding transcriptional LysR family regulator
VSQPAVSARVKALEAEIGAPLFLRGRGGVALTDPGRRFLPAAREIVRLVDEVRREAGGREGSPGLPLRIGATDTASTHLLPGAIRRYRASRPGAEVRVFVAASRPLVLGVLRGELDTALVTLPVRRSDLAVAPLLREDLWIVSAPSPSPGNPAESVRIARGKMRRSRGSLGAPALAMLPYLAYPRGSTTRRLVDEALRAVHLPVAASMEGGNPGVLRELARAGIGFAVLPRVLVEPDVRARNLARHRPPGFHASREIGILRRAGAPLSREVGAFLDALRALLPGKRGELRAFQGGEPE